MSTIAPTTHGGFRHSIAWLLRRTFLVILPAAALLTAASSANAQPVPIGTAVEVTPQATGELGGTEVTLLTGDQLYEGQTITTDANGEVQIIFVDDTRMVLGPNSALVIERYLLRTPDTVEDLTVNILGGAFRFISGNSPSESYTISTPTGDIVVRGTGFDGFVDWLTGLTEILLYNGSIYMCPVGLACIYIDVDCSIGILDLEEATIVREEGIRVALANEHFPFADAARSLLEEFRLINTARCLEDQNADDEAVEEEDPSGSSSEVSCSGESCECSGESCGCSGESCECSGESCGPSGYDPDYPCGNAPVSCLSPPECEGASCLICDSGPCYCPEGYEEECGVVGYKQPALIPVVYEDALRRLAG